MKKFSFLFLMALSIATVFTSCGDDEEVISTTPPILVKEYTATLLLPPLSGNTSETFFSTRNGKRYSFTTAASGANSDSVDFGYFYSSNFGASFMSPSNYAASTEWDGILASWKTKNQTTFKSVSNQTDNLVYFQSISRNGQVDTIFNNAGNVAVVGGTGVAGQRIGNLANGQLFVVSTVSGKRALVYVQNFTPGNGAVGNITIRVRSQG
jgi:hypothetical protein